MMLLKSLCIAFRTYSRIPVPEVDWTEENMKYSICFFPVIGVVIGAVEFLWMWLAGLLGVNQIFYAAAATAIPILLTGAIHMDGFCDTVDALSSHQSRERMLEILKDSHAGAFAIIFGALYVLLYAAGFYSIRDYAALWITAWGFVLSRSLSGLGVVSFQNARKAGMLYAFQLPAEKHTAQLVMLCGIVVSGIGMIACGGWRGVIVFVVNGLVFAYYYNVSHRKFGGITGDLAGWFLQLAELSTVLAVTLTARM